MATLEEVFASGGTDIIIRTLELICDAWTESVFICTGFPNLNRSGSLCRRPYSGQNFG